MNEIAFFVGFYKKKNHLIIKSLSLTIIKLRDLFVFLLLDIYYLI